MNRSYKRKVIASSNWTTEQDIYLIENSTLSMTDLCNHLPFNQDQIIERKELLGLIRRDRQMRKFHFK